MIEQYKVHEQIGQGEFGKVYRATNLLTQTVVAIKSVDVAKFNETPKLLELSMQEIEVLQKLQHCPYVVKFIELIKMTHQYHFVYEYCSGGPLDKLLLLQGHFTERKSLEIIYQLIQAFKVLRENSIIHRDLKPSNILIHNGIYKLADFGFCKPIKNDVTATMLGSPIYMAPEVLRGLSYNSKADIWSLGAVLYELLIGKCPFEEKSIAKLITAQDETDWVIPPQFHFTKQTITLMKSMLIKDPNKRCTWEYLFKIPLKNDGEFSGDLELYSEKPEQNILQPVNNNISNASILQEIVNERCKVQFMCQTAHTILEQSQNKESPLIAYYLLLLANNRGQQLLSVIKNQCTTATEYFSLNKLSIHLKQSQDNRLQSNFEFTRLVETISKEVDQLNIGLKEYKVILDAQSLEIKDNYRQNIKNYVNQIKQSNYVAFLDTNQEKTLLTHCVQVLDALQVDKFMNSMIDPTMDAYLEIRSMTKKQLLDRFDTLQ
ncbi:unnamed protein product [Paramecium pentaurelia]|uniref:Protein kinase domain-containing protein n=1 Tax=Paramecium pentaurelia TaxID=43138 RepID=A0A8S1W3C6_9CILI|nr:unnamed protein product [Paramecium pentaurelia]